jgi:hypothetical protein
MNEFEISVIETLVANNLLQECDELDGVVLIGFRQVDVFEIDDQSLGILWSIDLTLGTGGLTAHLGQLLDHMEG